MKLKTILYAAALLFTSADLKAQIISILQQDRSTSIRGLSIVDDNVAWLSGSGGNIATTTDGGKIWAWRQLKGYEKLDFRDIEAFSAKEAVIMSSGTPAVVLKTSDGGATWQEKYLKVDSAYFLDAMDFVDKKRGYIMGDPINGRFLMLETKNGGESWIELPNAPLALKDEAAFAASGTCLRLSGNLINIVTGGSNSRLLTTRVGKMTWLSKQLPLTNGAQSRGAFSSATGKAQTIVVGGDYAKNTIADSVAYLLPNEKATYKGSLPVVKPGGYQSCVEHLTRETFLSTGTSGSNITTDGGKTWTKIDAKSYNVCRKAKRGRLVLLAGDGGKIGIYTP